MVNHFYIYCVDGDFGPFFVKFNAYFPCNARFRARLGAESLNSALDRLVTGYDELLGSRQTLLEGRHSHALRL